MVLIWFLCLCTWKNRLLCLKLCCFYKTKVKMLKFAALMAKCLTNNLWKFHQKILNYSENNEISVGGCFFWPHPVDGVVTYIYYVRKFQTQTPASLLRYSSGFCNKQELKPVLFFIISVCKLWSFNEHLYSPMAEIAIQKIPKNSAFRMKDLLLLFTCRWISFVSSWISWWCRLKSSYIGIISGHSLLCKCRNG